MSYNGRIKFCNKEWIVVDKITYKDKKYYYIIEDISEEINNLENIEDYKGSLTVEFIYKLDNENYKNVTDKNILSELSAIIALKNLSNN